MSEQKDSSIPSPIRVSASALNNFGQCPYKYYLSRLWTPTGPEPIYFKHGRETHELMDGSRLEKDANAVSVKMAKKLSETERGLKLNIVHRELEQQFMIAPGIQLTRRIDGLGYDNMGHGLILDYKTANRAWSSISGWVPKVESWQTPAYLIPPPQDLLDELRWTGPWPTQMGYLIASAGGTKAQYFTTSVTDEWMVEFHKIIGHIKDMYKHDSFYRNRAWTCQWCSYTDVCQKVKGWKKNYERRD